MNYYNRGGLLSNLPQVTKNILIINLIIFGLVFILRQTENGLFYYLGLFTIQSPFFKPFQIVTHMFTHFGFMHFFFNMFGVFMFGRILETTLGAKKFFILYIVSGLGAAGLQLLITYFQMEDMLHQADIILQTFSADAFYEFTQRYNIYAHDNNFNSLAFNWLDNPENQAYFEPVKNALTQMASDNVNIPMVGASGALMGILAAFAVMFPNIELMLIFLPIPIKAKYFVPIFAVITLFMGVANFDWDNVAHFAHLGGAIVGFIVIMFWKKNQFKVY